MKKIRYKIIMIIFFAGVLLLLNKSTSNAATAGISASSTNVKAGDNVSINVSISAATWNLKVAGSGISDSIVGVDMDVTNKSTSKSYKLNTSNPGTYTVSLSGDITDANGSSKNISSSVTVKVSEKNNSNTTKSTTEESKEPSFTKTNQTVYATGDVNVRSSYSTSSSSVGSLKKGDSVTRIGVGSNGWSKVTFNGKTAYINSSYLTTTKPKEEKSINKALKSLAVEPAGLDPEFNKDTTNYTLTVEQDVTSLKINAEAEDEKAKVSISGNENLQEGDNTVKIVVTAEDGTARTYTIIVTKQKKTALKLQKLEINGINLNETFNPDTYKYTATLNGTSNLTNLDVKAVANQEDAIIEIIGNDNLVIGENVITVIVKSKDDKENVTYQILVNKLENTSITGTNKKTQKGNILLFTGIGMLIFAILIIIFMIVKRRKKSDNEDADIGFNYSDDISDDLYGLKSQDDNTKQEIKESEEKIVEENSSDEIKSTKLYDVEKEVDFSDEDKKARRKGKHSK